MIETGSLFAILLIFLLAGFIKGIVGMGLPTVSLGLMAVFLPLPMAMALVVIPSAVTNFWQACVGGHGLALLRRYWGFFITAFSFIWIGGLVLKTELLVWLPAILGLLLVAHGTIGLAGIGLRVRPDRELPVGLALGTINGVLTGMTGSFTVPGVLFLQSADLSRDQLVQAMGILFLISTLGLAIALYGNGFYSTVIGWNSVLALVPALAGMAIGQKVRQKLSERLFKKLFLISLVLLGVCLVALIFV